MILYIVFILMIGASVLWFFRFWYKPLLGNDINLQKSNIALGKQRQIELNQDLDGGLIDKISFDDAKDEITQTLAIELNNNSIHNSAISSKISHWYPIFGLVFITVMSLGIYQALSPQETLISEQIVLKNAGITLEEQATALNGKLLINPADAEDWQTLGLTYFELNRLDESVKSYEQSHQLNPLNSDLLVEYAAAVTYQNNNHSGKPTKLINKALELDPGNHKALYISGLFALNTQQFGVAKKLFEKALASPQLDTETSLELTHLVDKISDFTGDNVQFEKHSVTINVYFSKMALSNSSKDDYVMVYIKNATGSPMPIAIRKIKMGNFSGSVILTDSDSVMPTKKLSQAHKIIAVVRLSKSGLASKGDLDKQTVSQEYNIKDNPTINLHLK